MATEDGMAKTQKSIGTILLFTAIACLVWIVYVGLDINFWVSPPKDKFNISWSRDITLLEKSGKLPKQWSEIREIKIQADNSPIQDWLIGYKAPIRTEREGKYRLAIFIVHWIEGNRYGVLVNYQLNEINSNNSIWESARTLPLGIVY